MILPALLLALLAGPPPARQEPAPPDDLTALALLDPAALEARVDALVAEFGELVEKQPLFLGTTTRAGRPLYALRLAAPDAPDTRPALLLVANVDGPLVFASALALSHCETLARRHRAGDEAARAFLARTTLYVVPCANPDGAAMRFADPREERAATGPAADTDRDGRTGEDGTADLDGDGRILQMRVEDPEGTWIEDPDDPRALREAVPAQGQLGRWKLWPEGLDDDGDEAIAEDRAHDAEVNANFAHGWREHAPAAGRYPHGEPEARALAEFVMLHEEISLVLTYGLLDNLVETPKGAEPQPGRRVPPDAILEQDAPFLAELGKRYRELVAHEAKGRGAAGGTFQEWAYHHRGLPSLAVVPWDIPLDAKPSDGTAGTGGSGAGAAEAGAEEAREGVEAAGEPTGGAAGGAPDDPAGKKPKGVGDDAKRLIWIDRQGPGEAWRFAAWQPFEHPQLGPVELGGFAPFARLEPPAADAPRIAADQLAFLLSLAEVQPGVQLAEASARALGGGLVEVEVAVTNRALLPARTRKAIDARVGRAPSVELVLPDGAALLAGRRIEFVTAEALGSGARAKLRWLVGGMREGAALGLRLTSDRAGSETLSLEVQR